MFIHDSSTQHEYMLIRIISNVLAIVAGCGAAVTTTQLTHTISHFNFIELITNAETYAFIFRCVIGAALSLAVKVYGDMIITKWKERRTHNNKKSNE